MPFWADKDKNRIFTEVALETGSSIVDLSHLGGGLEPLNFAHSENKYSHAGVAAHPGDYGMANIAKVIFSVARNMRAEFSAILLVQHLHHPPQTPTQTRTNPR